MGRQRSCTNLWRRYPPDPSKMGGGSGYISGRFAIGSSDFLLLQQRRLRLHWPRSLLAVDTPRSWTQRPRSARLIRLSTRPSIAAVPVSFAAAIRRLSRKSLKEQIGVLIPRLTADPLADSHRDWFCSLNLKDAYFHIQIAPHHRRFLRFAFEGVAYQYTVLPFGLSLALRTFMKCMDAALSPLRQMGIRILNYLDDWLILAQSEVELLSHRTLILSHFQGQFRQKRTVSQPTSIVPGYSSGLSSHESGDSARTRSGHSETRGHLQERHRSPTQSVSENAGPYGRSIASVTAGPAPYAPPSNAGFKPRVPHNAWRHGRLHIRVNQACVTALTPWKNPRWMKKGMAMGLVHTRKVVTTDASNTGWGALCEGKPTFGHWSKAESGFHINCLEMLAVCRACQFFLSDLIGRHVLIRSDSMSVVSYINHQGGVSSKRLFILAERLLEWAQLNLRSLRAAHLPGRLNQGADMLSRSNVPSEEWMLHPQVVQKIWKTFGKAEVDNSKDNSHCPTYYSKDRDALAHDWLRS